MTDERASVTETATDEAVTAAADAVACGKPAADVYLDAVLREAPRVLGLMDREEYSPTFGCLDRTHWAWKFTDFADARFQEGLCVMSFLYGTACNGNPYHENPRMLDWIAGGFDFWVRLQRSSGDFDEAYPFERSLAATAFTSFYLCEAWNFLDGRLPHPAADRFRRALERSADWLVKNDETHGFLSNHLAAAAAALYHAYRICGQSRFEVRGRYFVDRILEHHSPEGWYEEYGGADPGYQSHGSFYLARCLELDRDSRLAESLERSLDFLAHFVHPDGSLGGEYASRNTQTYYPAAFEIMAQRSGKASWIAATMLPSIQNLAAAGLGSVDAFNYFPLLNNMVFAYVASARRQRNRAEAVPPAQEPGITHFPDAGIVKIRKHAYEAYVGLTKGGVIKAFDRRARRLIYNDCGYMGRLKNGKLLTSQWCDESWTTDVSEDEVVVRGCFYAIKRPIMKPLSFLGFRLFNLTLGRIAGVSHWLKRLLVKALIYRRRDLPILFQRCIIFRENGFTVRDEIQSSPGAGIDRLQWVDRFTTIHMGSSRYYVPNELNVIATSVGETRTSIDPARLVDGVTIERTVHID